MQMPMKLSLGAHLRGDARTPGLSLRSGHIRVYRVWGCLRSRNSDAARRGSWFVLSVNSGCLGFRSLELLELEEVRLFPVVCEDVRHLLKLGLQKRAKKDNMSWQGP